jgi:hypothetical protein
MGLLRRPWILDCIGDHLILYRWAYCVHLEILAWSWCSFHTWFEQGHYSIDWESEADQDLPGNAGK